MHSARIFLFSRFVGAVTGEVKKFVLRIFAAVDIGVRSLVIRDMQISHPRRLPAQLIADHCQTGAIERGPYFLNFVRVFVREPDAACRS